MPGGGKGGGSSTVNVTNGPITVDSDSTVDVKGLDKVGLTAKIDPLEITQVVKIPDPIVTKSTSESKSDITTKSDINSKSDSDSRSALSVDLKPVVLDVCSTTSTKLPQGEVIQPFHLHFGMTMFGMEMLGFTLSGEQRTVMKKLPKKPQVDWPAQQNARHHHEGHHHEHHDAGGARGAPAQAPQPAGAPRAGGLRIRIK